MTHHLSTTTEPADLDQLTDAEREFVDRHVEDIRAEHRRECPGCTCVEKITVDVIFDAMATSDVEGDPLGVSTHRRPMPGVSFTTKETR